MKNAIANHENIFYLNGSPLSGVFGFDGSYDFQYTPINVIGRGFVKQVFADVPQASISISRLLINKDPSFNLTGEGRLYQAKPVNGGLYYDGKYFGFQNAYLNSMSLSCSVGDIPQIQTSFNVYGDIGSGFNPSGDKYAGGVFAPQVKDINLVCRNYCTNRITDFQISFSTPKKPIYALSASGAHVPVAVKNIYPIEVDTSFTLEVDDYEVRDAFKGFSYNNERDFSIGISGKIFNDEPLTVSSGSLESLTAETGAPEILYCYLKSEGAVSIFDFNVVDGALVSEQINSQSDGVMSVKLTYKSYLN